MERKRRGERWQERQVEEISKREKKARRTVHEEKKETMERWDS